MSAVQFTRSWFGFLGAVSVILSTLLFSLPAQAAGGGFVYSDQTSQTAQSPGLAFFKDRLFQVHVGLNGRIYTSSCLLVPSGPPTCAAWQDYGGSTDTAVTMAVFNNRLYQTHRGLNGQIFTRSSADGTSWSGWSNNGGQTNSAIFMAGFKNKLYQVHRSLNGRVFTRSASDGVTWSEWTTRGDGITNGAIGMAGDSNFLCQSHSGLNTRIYTRCSSDGLDWTSWEEFGGRSELPISLTNYQDGSLSYTLQFHRGGDQRLYYRVTGPDNWIRWSENSKTNNFISASTSGTPTNTICISYRALDNRVFIECDFM